MTVKDLQIDSPVYRIGYGSIDIARVRAIEAFNDGTRAIELNPCWTPRFVAKNEDVELRQQDSTKTVWYINVGDAELAQLMLRSELVEKLKKDMERAQNDFADAVNKYAFSEPSTPKEL